MGGQAAAYVHFYSITLLLTTTVIFFFSTTAFSGAEEGEALLRFKATLSGTGADLPSWIPGPAPCNLNDTAWAGILCLNGHVRGIQLEDMGLAGHLDLSPLAALLGLRTITFMRNDLEGPFPDVGRLGALKAVYLSENRFSGEIPSGAFEGMRSLKKIIISNNGFTGTIPESLAGLERLLEARLDHNKFVGGIPEFSQPRLETVDFSFNDLEGPIPVRFSKVDPALFQGNEKLCGAPLATPCNGKQHPKLGLSGWLVAGVILSFLAVLLILIVCRLRCRRRKDPSLATQTTPVDADSAELGGVSESKRKDARVLVFLQKGRERFELQELLRASAEILGSGNFGSSYKAVMPAGPTVVVKRFKEMNKVGRDDFSEHMRRLGRLSHPNLLPLIAYYYKKDEKLLLTDFVPNGSLAHMLHGKRGWEMPRLDWETRLKIVKGVARGMAYLYDELAVLSIPHGHLKSSNVLLNETFEPLLSDYGLVPVMNVRHAWEVMVAYKSPEVNMMGRPSKKSDVWSLGILILEILTGKFPANFLHKGSGGTDLAAWVSSVVQEEWSSEVFDEEMGDTGDGQVEMQKLLKVGMGCCEENVEKRMDMREALQAIEKIKEREG